MALDEELAKHLMQFQTAPFLFIGSGMSRRYMGLESWEALLEKFSVFTDHPYAFYRSKAESDLPIAASLIAANFNEKWWTEAKYADSRKSYEKFCTSERSALKIEICRYLSEVVSKRATPAELAVEIDALKSVVVDGIITTNWDLFIESVFPDFKPYIGQDQLLFGSPQGIAEIYKIHGSVTDPNSLVLTNEDYQEFNKKNPYLAAKLLTTFIEHPIVFIGYSLSDKNILSIIEAITGCLSNTTVAKLQDRLIFIEWKQGVKDGSMVNSVINQGGIQIPVKYIVTDSFTPIYKAMSEIQRRFPAQVLRRLKDQVYDLVLNNDSKSKLYVKDIDENTPAEDIDVVFGVGAIKKLQEVGYVGISRDHILRDIVYDDGDFNAESLLVRTMDGIMKGGTKFVPIFKYLRKSGRINPDGTINIDGLPDRVIKGAAREREFFYPTQATYRKKFESRRSYKKGISYIESKEGVECAVNMACFLDPDFVSCDDLKDFVKKHIRLLDGKSTARTAMSRLICFYDWACYGRALE